ncbi:MAG: hypothetical protein LBJ17_01650 [Dysgonamonadaceae bacterium]|jgi:hypothetical protein|nr:hypothetical protein [Dysgonamonadaceae bacterium]
MFKLTAKITVTGTKTWVFRHVSECEIERDIEKITSTCKLRLPKRTKWANESEIPVRRGDKIKVELGYDERLETVFTGYVRTVGAKVPVEISCEDEMFTLKMLPAKKKTYSSGNLQEILDDQIGGACRTKVHGRQNIGQYTVNSDTVAQLLGEFAESGILSFFRDGVLYCGAMFDHEAEITGLTPVYRFGDGGNIIDDSSLEQNSAEDTRLKIMAKGTDRDGKKISCEVGDSEGEIRTFFKYNTTEEELKAEAKGKLAEWKVDGLTGSFSTFGDHPRWLLDVIKIVIEGSGYI